MNSLCLITLSREFVHLFAEFPRLLFFFFVLGVCETPETADKKRGRKKKGKVLNLIGRLDKYKASVFLFIKNFCVPFDNNLSERDVRMVKVKTKVSGCFRSMEGAQEYLTIMSYIGTARKHGMNPYEAIRSALSGNPDIIFG